MRFVLVRHGEPAWREDGINRDDPRLTDVGHRQAALAAVVLSEMSFDHVWISTKLRAMETAEPYINFVGSRSAAAGVAHHSYLEEIQNPLWEGTDHDVMEIFAAHRRRHPEAQWDGLEGGEAVTKFRHRVCSGLDAALSALGVTQRDADLPLWDIAQDALDLNVLVFAHAGTNSVLLTHLLGVEPVPWEWERFVTGHASISEVSAIEVGDAYSFSMEQLSGTRHLPDHLLTR